MERSKSLSVGRIVFCAVFAALTAICSQIQIPLPMVPINLALFSVHLCGAVLGTGWGIIKYYRVCSFRSVRTAGICRIFRRSRRLVWKYRRLYFRVYSGRPDRRSHYQ